MNPFEAILLQLAEAASAEFLQALVAALANKLNAAPAKAVVAPQVAPVAASGTGILAGFGHATSISLGGQTS